MPSFALRLIQSDIASNPAPDEVARPSDSLAVVLSNSHDDDVDGNSTLYLERRSTNTSLPAEILGYIFLCSLHMYKRIRPRFDEAPLVFCHVCSFWRRTALGTSRLWGSLSFDTRCYKHVPTWDVAQLFTFWLRNGTPHPLVFSMIDKLSSPSTPDALRAVAPFSDRLIELNLCGQSLAFLEPFLNTANGRFNRLRILVLDTAEGDQLKLEPNVPILSDAPSLQVLGIRGSRILEYLSFPWSQLSVLLLDRDLNPFGWHSVFSQCINLQSGTFTIDSDENDESDDDNTYDAKTYEKLTAFKLTLETDFDLAVFGNFELPNLHTFHLVNRHWDTVELDVIDVFEQLQLNDHLQDLALANLVIDPEDLISMITSVQSLIRLALDVQGLDFSEFFDELHAAIMDESILVNLSSFIICVPSDLDESSFIRFIQSLSQCERRQHLGEVSLFVRAWVGFPGDPQRIIDNVRMHLKDLIYDKDTCPDGFIFTADTVDEAFDIRSVLVRT
ncbi:hypothetical protein Hypma_006157 [Hypsizygus marmoreus]|uniref:F-box domain-containing protein n=1 Tax=Hypsizygus marmoreus TaxID=39966 RepID=A0A369JWB3_HYPMA|nr:hypothetical protein Hypma_006157 [Hypsizygus marmoreus]